MKKTLLSALVLFATFNASAMMLRRAAQAASSSAAARSLVRRISYAAKYNYATIEIPEKPSDEFMEWLDQHITGLEGEGWELAKMFPTFRSTDRKVLVFRRVIPSA